MTACLGGGHFGEDGKREQETFSPSRSLSSNEHKAHWDTYPDWKLSKQGKEQKRKHLWLNNKGDKLKKQTSSDEMLQSQPHITGLELVFCIYIDHICLFGPITLKKQALH